MLRKFQLAYLKKTEHAAVKKPRILQDIAGAEQADTAELGQKGTANEDGENNPQFGQDGDSLIDRRRSCMNGDTKRRRAAQEKRSKDLSGKAKHVQQTHHLG
ncbi:hypothetical protein C8J57DRAFT_1235863 [Mycena rebaudengoi]|nr:hypothetical protein C8J57DRAFT_1235863 [Mycena rebaudengoi]